MVVRTVRLPHHLLAFAEAYGMDFSDGVRRALDEAMRRAGKPGKRPRKEDKPKKKTSKKGVRHGAAGAAGRKPRG